MQLMIPIPERQQAFRLPAGVLDGSEEEFFHFCQSNRELQIERTAKGEMIVMSPVGGYLGYRSGEVFGQLRTWAGADGTGLAFDSSTGFVVPGGAMRSPDAAWVRLSRLKELSAWEKERFLVLRDFSLDLARIWSPPFWFYTSEPTRAERASSPAPREIDMASGKNNGIINVASKRSVDETVEKLKGILQAKGVTLFALVDHSGEAEKVGLKMPPTKLLIFGSPKAGTPLMLASPSIAIDLPLKLLVWEDAQGKVWVSYNSPAYLQERHGLPQDLLQNIAVIETLAAKTAE